MNIQEIIDQEITAFNAEENVKQETQKNKATILLPLATKIFDFLELIQNDEEFLFSSEAHPKEESWGPLFSNTTLTLSYFKDKVQKNINKRGWADFTLRKLGFGNGYKTISFEVTEGFLPLVKFDDETFYSAEEAIRAMMKLFLRKRKK